MLYSIARLVLMSCLSLAQQLLTVQWIGNEIGPSCQEQKDLLLRVSITVTVHLDFYLIIRSYNILPKTHSKKCFLWVLLSNVGKKLCFMTSRSSFSSLPTATPIIGRQLLNFSLHPFQLTLGCDIIDCCIFFHQKVVKNLSQCG